MKILVVDPTSSGRDLVAELRARPGVTVDIYQQQHPFEPTEDDSCRLPEENLVALSRFGGYGRIVAGSESGVSAADRLSDLLGLPCNEPRLLWHRRNKLGMVWVAAEAGLRVPRTWSFHHLDEISQMRQVVQSFPHGVVVKPAGSGGSDSCFICHTFDEIADAVRRVLSSENLFGNRNTDVIVQERVLGEQYFVNAVSGDGRHVVTEVFRYGITEDSGVPHIRTARTVEAEDVARDCVEYVLSLLDALGVRHGASHTEVRVDDAGVCLIEYNGRSMGPAVPSAVYVPARGFSQVTVLADALVHEITAAMQTVDTGRSDHCVGWHMPTPQRSGRLESVNWSALTALSSFLDVYAEPPIGTRFDLRTRVTTGAAGLVFFAHPDPGVVERDLERSVAAEHADAFFTLA